MYLLIKIIYTDYRQLIILGQRNHETQFLTCTCMYLSTDSTVSSKYLKYSVTDISKYPFVTKNSVSFNSRGWSGGAMVLGKLPVPGRPTIWITVGQGPTALAVCAGGVGLDIFTLICPFSPLSPSLWETARYRLKYCLKGLLNPKLTNQPNSFNSCYSKLLISQIKFSGPRKFTLRYHKFTLRMNFDFEMIRYRELNVYGQIYLPFYQNGGLSDKLVRVFSA